jgi:hypothetical protein
MERSSSLLEVFSLVVVSARAGGPKRARRPLICRSELMLMQMRHGKTPCAELVVDGGRADMRALLPRRGEPARHPTYRVTRLDGRVLHARALLPRKRGMPAFRIRVRHPDGSVDRLRPVQAVGLVTETPLAVRLRRGRTVIEIEGAGRIDLQWDGGARD